MDASYIPIAEARGFTTHWIRDSILKVFLYELKFQLLTILFPRHKNMLLI